MDGQRIIPGSDRQGPASAKMDSFGRTVSEPGDLAVTDPIGTDPDDPAWKRASARRRMPKHRTMGRKTNRQSRMKPQEPAMDGNASDESEKTDVSEDSEQPVTSEEDVEEAVEELDLSRRHVLTRLAGRRPQTLVRRPTWAKIAIHQDGRRQSLLHMRILHSAEG